MFKFQLAGKRSECEKMPCHAVLKNLYEPKRDVILTISFKILTAEIEIRKHMFCLLLRRGIVSALYGICFFIAMKCVYFVVVVVFFFTVNSSVNAARSSLKTLS